MNTGKIIIRMPANPSNVLVPRFGVELVKREYGVNFFVAKDDRRELRQLPENLFSGDFMKLDASNVSSLLSFQNQYGMMFPIESGMRFSGGLWAQSDWNRFNTSIEKVQESVRELQDRINVLSSYRFMIDNPSKDNELPINDVYGHCERLSKHFGEYFPYVEFQDEDMMKECLSDVGRTVREDSLILPLLVAIEVQLADALAGGEAFKRCKSRKCRNVFQYKQGAHRGGASYCCEQCRIDEGNANRKKPARKELNNG